MVNVQPGLPDDPKYLRLKKALKPLGADGLALEFLVRLWGHCQLNQRGEFWNEADPEYVEAVCRWDGDTGQLFAVLEEKGWLDLEENGVRIHDWGENNSGLASSWKNGKLGGRKKRRRTGDTTHGKPDGNPPATHGKPDGEPMNEGKKELNEGSTSHAHFPEIQVPSEKEVVEEGKIRGFPEAVCRKFYDHYETKNPRWTSNGCSFDWRRKLRAWYVRDQEQTSVHKKNAAPASNSEIEDIKAELQWQKEPARIEFLKKRRKELEGDK